MLSAGVEAVGCYTLGAEQQRPRAASGTAAKPTVRHGLETSTSTVVCTPIEVARSGRSGAVLSMVQRVTAALLGIRAPCGCALRQAAPRVHRRGRVPGRGLNECTRGASAGSAALAAPPPCSGYVRVGCGGAWRPQCRVPSASMSRCGCWSTPQCRCRCRSVVDGATVWSAPRPRGPVAVFVGPLTFRPRKEGVAASAQSTGLHRTPTATLLPRRH